MKKIVLASLLLCLFSTYLLAFDHDKVNQFWKDNEFDQLELYLKNEIENNNDYEAYLNLFFLYELYGKNKEATTVFMEGIEYYNPRYPYLRCLLSNSPVSEELYSGNKKVLSFFQSLKKNHNNNALIYARAMDHLTSFYKNNCEETKAEEIINELGLIKEWSIIGPFDNISASGYDKTYPPETEFDTGKIYHGKDNMPINWFKNTPFKYFGWVDIKDFITEYHAVNYANSFVFSPSTRKVQIRFGTSGACKLFLNDSLIMQYKKETNNGFDTFIVETELQKGWNRILIKLAHSEISRCNFTMRFTDQLGVALNGLQYSIEPQQYESNTKPTKKIVQDDTEIFFKDKIEANPSVLSNYILLAKFYLEIDRNEKAEIILNKAYGLFPESVLVDYHLMKAYSGNDKPDFVKMKIEEIDSVTDRVKAVYEYKIEEYLSNEEFDKVHTYLEKYSSKFGKDVNYSKWLLGYYAYKEMYKELIELMEENYKRFPDNYDMVDMKAMFVIETEQDYKKAIKYSKKFLKKKQTFQAYSDLAYYYKQDNQLNNWEKTLKEQHDLYPTTPTPLYKFASGLFDLKRYSEAKSKIEKAIEIRPFDDDYWEFYGSCENMLGNKEAAIANYQKAIQLNPLSYSARDLLRELEEKPSIFHLFPTADLDSLTANAPLQEDFPEDRATILLKNRNVIVYPEGGFRSQNELLIRVFNKNGIQSFTEFTVPILQYYQNYVIEEAITYKANGNIIKADVKNNSIVFKQLEEEDFIYVRWKTKNYYHGKLLTHFWDYVHFNHAFPVQNNTYSIMFAEQETAQETFNHQTENFTLEPTVNQSEEGVIYKWNVSNEPSIKPEDNMPTLEDIGKILYVSSIPDWQFIIDWYRDLANAKAEITYEIEEIVLDLLDKHNPQTKEEKIKMVYQYITENITYSSVSFRQSGLIPQKARDVLITKIGDCKDVSTLSVAMLKELGIDSYLTLVGTNYDNNSVQFLPTIDVFDHCITAAEIDNKWIYLDHTARNYPPETVPYGDIGAYSLKIYDESEPEYLSKSYFEPSFIDREGKIEIKTDKSIYVELSNKRSGYFTAGIRNQYRELNNTKRKKKLLESISHEIANAKLIDYSFPAIDSLHYILNYSYTYQAEQYLKETGSFIFLSIPWSEKLTQSSALSYDERTYPINSWNYGDYEKQTFKISIPDEFELVEMLSEKQYQCKYGSYSLSMKKENSDYILSRELIINETQIPPEDYKAFKTFYNNIVAADETTVLLKRK